ncbi:hypothetical protein N7471_001614 [Penicillium samsonianum]|uniref:uncharacterized protein n=1 Tax=Penicillium samsonianum TaxID=1882272 RepID=UPI0025497177|nr:uncharacterized protein N7471_001614 [Penicillium samsonianum]KAJ6150415.1 hypothetical protein N7471_001614 [Penicillium samsonianum]
MHFVNLAAFACAVISASAFEFPDFVPLHKRQDPGTPAYECHANCGGVITAGRSDGYCDTDNFKTELTDCLNCAVEFDIWKYYGGSVSKAATACGLDATPVEASSTTTSVSATTASDSASATKTAEETINSTVTTDAATSSTGTTVASTSVSPPRVSGSSRSSALIPSATPTGSSTASTPSSSPVYTGGAMMNTGSGLVSGAFVGCLIAAFM